MQAISSPLERTFPLHGTSAEEVLGQLDELQAGITSEVSGKLSVNSLKGRDDIQALVQQAYVKFFPYNALFSRMEASEAKIENDVLDICVELMNGGDQARANLTGNGADLWRMGGSIAQRDLVDWTLTEAAIRGGLRDVALALTNERLALRPDSTINQRFLEAAQAIGV